MMFEAISPELQEKIAACKTPEELLALAKEEGRELSDDEIEMIAGGSDGLENIISQPIHCPHCGEFYLGTGTVGEIRKCTRCGKEFELVFG